MDPKPRTREEVEALIFNAFGNVGRKGGVSWSESYVYDQYGSDTEKAAARAKDKDTGWQELVDDPNWNPDPGVGGFSFMDPIGFAYYIPAAAIRTLRAGHDVGSVGFQLKLRPGLQESWLDKWSRLNDSQCRAITAFLRFMAFAEEGAGRAEWLEAYWRHWHSFDPEPLPPEPESFEEDDEFAEYRFWTDVNWKYYRDTMDPQDIEWENHPRYGNKPRITGLNPQPLVDGAVLHWHGEGCRIPDTAIKANETEQVQGSAQITHYFDHGNRCRDCGKPFIFFAEEQKYWYETLKFQLGADCVHCLSCRRKERHVASLRATYESLEPMPTRTFEQDAKLISASLSLVELGVFKYQALMKVRALLNQLEGQVSGEKLKQWSELKARASAVKAAGWEG